jgi:hypothetical protein
MTHVGERMGVPERALGFSSGAPSLSPSLAGRKTGRRARSGTPILLSNAVLSPTRFTFGPSWGPKVNLVRPDSRKQGR